MVRTQGLKPRTSAALTGPAFGLLCGQRAPTSPPSSTSSSRSAPRAAPRSRSPRTSCRRCARASRRSLATPSAQARVACRPRPSLAPILPPPLLPSLQTTLHTLHIAIMSGTVMTGKKAVTIISSLSLHQPSLYRPSSVSGTGARTRQPLCALSANAASFAASSAASFYPHPSARSSRAPPSPATCLQRI